MGTLRKNINQKTTKKDLVSYKKNVRSKGNRLGWVSIYEVKSVDLSNVLSKGEEVILKDNNTPLLVP